MSIIEPKLKNGRKSIQNAQDEFGIGGEEGSSIYSCCEVHGEAWK
jgi:hypothetical protein